MRRFRAFLAFAVAGAVASVAITQKHPAPVREQTSFTAEDEGVKSPVAVPDDVLSVLAADHFVQDSMKDNRSPLKQPPRDWFSASVIHLGSPEEKDLIIEAKGPLRGANVDTFWVFFAKAEGHVLVLSAPVHDLKVLNTRWKGYREIELFSATAVECSTVRLRYNGAEYTEYRTKSGPIPNC